MGGIPTFESNWISSHKFCPHPNYVSFYISSWFVQKGTFWYKLQSLSWTFNFQCPSRQNFTKKWMAFQLQRAIGSHPFRSVTILRWCYALSVLCFSENVKNKGKSVFSEATWNFTFWDLLYALDPNTSHRSRPLSVLHWMNLQFPVSN